MKRLRQWLTVGVFGAMLFGFAAAHLLLPDGTLSREERRKLAQMPEVTMQGLSTGAYGQALETYLLDQFPLRQGFRTANALFRRDLLRQQDVNGYYLTQGSICKVETQLDEKQVTYAAEKLRTVYETYLTGMNVQYAVIPDKGYYAAGQSGHPSLDYDRLLQILDETLPDSFGYLDLFDTLTLEDYYTTDTHWRQERLLPAAQRLLDGFGCVESVGTLDDYETYTLSPFYGVYYGQAALPVAPDTLTYLVSPATAQSMVTGPELEGEQPVYSEARFAGLDGYDLFLHGAQAVLTIQNPTVQNGRRLVLFRDSFGSSIAPLLLAGYEEITLVDLRYISSQILDQYVEFEDQDVLFLYGVSLLNGGRVLR